MDRDPDTQEDCGKATPNNAKQASKIVIIFACGSITRRFVHGQIRMYSRGEEVNEEEEKHSVLWSFQSG
jgi:hypothetical protein